MRKVLGSAAIVVLGAGASMLAAAPAQAVCSVFDKHPCAPTVCSVFQRRPCLPEIEYWVGQDLRLTIESARTEKAADGASHDQPTEALAQVRQEDSDTQHKLDSIRELFAALRACWIPPPGDEARAGMQMSVRLSFKRSGEIIGTPRVTYATPEAAKELRENYLKAITAALERCTPLPFTKGLGGAIAGRPIAIRYVDNRTFKEHAEQP
jgi:hypothetical protein